MQKILVARASCGFPAGKFELILASMNRPAARQVEAPGRGRIQVEDLLDLAEVELKSERLRRSPQRAPLQGQRQGAQRLQTHQPPVMNSRQDSLHFALPKFFFHP